MSLAPNVSRVRVEEQEDAQARRADAACGSRAGLIGSSPAIGCRSTVHLRCTLQRGGARRELAARAAEWPGPGSTVLVAVSVGAGQGLALIH